MALRSWSFFPASGHANPSKVFSKGGSRQCCTICHNFAVLSFSSHGDNAKERHVSNRAPDTVAFRSLYKADSTKASDGVSTTEHLEASDAASVGERAETSAEELGTERRYPATRRALIACTLAGHLTSGCSHFDDLPSPLRHVLGHGVAQASLVQMPPESLNNRYYLVRAGESEFERIGVINTNPVAKTNMESGLSEIGRKQVVKAARQLRDMGACDGSCWIWPSITQRAYQAAELIAYANNISRSRIVPEYSFLDARGLGAYEGKSLSYINKVYEVDAESPNMRPPPYTDGTPNESVTDVFVRVTQLMSILETQYFAESIIIVSPDSDNLSVLQAALTGLDLRRHNLLAFAPGEVRYVDLDKRTPQRITRQSGLLKCENPSQCG